MSALSTLCFQLSCAPTPEPRLKIGEAYAVDGTTYYPQIQPDYKQVGLASWYGDEFHKKRTANGEVFDKGEYTAAHKTLPLPSIVKVTNLDNGRSILVRVNDRGPFVRGRIIDVSENAAKALGFYGHGTAHVEVELDKAASLLLLNDPTLKIREAEKKLILESYLKDMPPSQPSRGSQSIASQPITQTDTEAKIHPEQQRIQKTAALQQAALKQQAKAAGVPKQYYEKKDLTTTQTQALQASLPSQTTQPQKKGQTKKAGRSTQKDGSTNTTGKDISHQQNQSTSQGQMMQPQVQQAAPSAQQPAQLQSQTSVQQQTQRVATPPQEIRHARPAPAPMPQQHQLQPAPRIQPSQLPQKNTTEKNVSPQQQQAPQAAPQQQTAQPQAQQQMGKYKIQIASSPSESDAKKIALSLQNLSSKIVKANVNGKVYFRVQLIGFATKAEAQNTLNSLKSKGYKDAFIF